MCRGDKLLENYEVFDRLLISRFKEREENVKYEIFDAYIALLKQTALLVPENFQRQQVIMNIQNIGLINLFLASNC